MNPTIYDAIVYRFNEDGTNDNEFADGGVYSCNFKGVFDTVETQDEIDKLQFKANGDILLLGSTSPFKKATGASVGGRYLRLLNGDLTRLPWAVRIRRWIHNHILHFTNNDPNASTSYYVINKNVNSGNQQIAKLPRNNSGVYSFNLPNADQSTAYTVTAIQSNGEAVSSFQIADGATETVKKSIKLWPNPVTNLINIEADFVIKTIEIQHIQTNRVQRVNGNNASTMKVQTAPLQPGMYSIIIIGANGERVHEKFVKE